ncbi:unnamed protein product [Notodromas monacha]|uniref:Glycine N-acyltransferase-like protein n=1 Tax=Notodromas monacha TaxID=399045 RepID=A0A7R9BZ72_9CRUS|nr:unnamed protein product [Notodromas monacha]CAG0923251.1 unnamed protein product [Notodromas monacha]
MAIGVIHEPSQQLVGWFLMQETGCQGILHVTEEHRGKGIAQVLVREMQETLLGLNLEPVSVILDTNEPSYRLFRKSGYDAEHSVQTPFPPQKWNIHQAVLIDLGATNNFSEAWNCYFNGLVGKKNPTICLLIRCLKQDAASVATTLKKFDKDGTSHAMRRASLESGKHGGLLLVQGTRNDSIS